MKKLLLSFGFTFAFVVLSHAEFSNCADVSIADYTGNAISEFPVLVKINSAKLPGVYQAVKHGGADLKFTDANGNGNYPFEVDTWNPSGTSYVWVRLPSFSSTTTFRMYYGDNSVTENNTAADVWNGYDLVCHLNGSGVDSTSHNVPYVMNTNAGSVSDAVIGTGYGTANANTGPVFVSWLYQGATTGNRIPLEDSVFSVSFWFRYNGTPGSWAGQFVGLGAGWNINATGSPHDTVQMNTSNEGADQYYPQQNGGFGDDTWIKINAVYDGTSMYFYKNGAMVKDKNNVGPKTAAKVATISSHTWLGWGGSVNYNTATPTLVADKSLAIDYDECRVHGSAVSADRIAAEYFVEANDACVFTSANLCEHEYGAWTTNLLATCEVPGQRRRECGLCHAYEYDEIEALGHDLNAWHYDPAPTCLVGGKNVRSCQRTGCTYSEEIPVGALGHDWDDGEITTEPTEFSAGIRTFTCNRCHDTRTEPVPSLSSYIYVDSDALDGGVGTIVSPYNTLEAAYAAASSGKSIYLKGTFAVFANSVNNFVIDKENIVFDKWPDSSSKPVITTSGATQIMSDNTKAWEINVPNVTFRNLDFQFKAAVINKLKLFGVNGTNVKFENCDFTIVEPMSNGLNGQAGIFSATSKVSAAGLTIRGCSFTDFHKDVVRYSYCLIPAVDDVEVSNCVFERCSTIFHKPAGGSGDNVKFLNNKVFDTVASLPPVSGTESNVGSLAWATDFDFNHNGYEFAYNVFKNTTPGGCVIGDAAGRAGYKAVNVHNNTVIGYDSLLGIGMVSVSSIPSYKLVNNLLIDTGSLVSDTNGVPIYTSGTVFKNNCTDGNIIFKGANNSYNPAASGAQVAGNASIQIAGPFNASDPANDYYCRVQRSSNAWALQGWTNGGEYPEYIGAYAPYGKRGMIFYIRMPSEDPIIPDIDPLELPSGLAVPAAFPMLSTELAAKLATLTWGSLGTSITWYNDHQNGFEKGYQTRVMEALGMPSSALDNYGSNGMRVDNAMNPSASNDIYTIEFGVNDWMQGHTVGTLNDYKNPPEGNDNFAAAYRRKINAIRAQNPDAIIILCTPRKAYGFNDNLPASTEWGSMPQRVMTGGETTYMKQYVKLIRQIAEYEGFPVCEWYNNNVGNQNTLADLSIDVALHPNDAGFDLMARALAPVIVKAVRDKYFPAGEEEVVQKLSLPWNVQVMTPQDIVIQYDGWDAISDYQGSSDPDTSYLSGTNSMLRNGSFTVSGAGVTKVGYAIQTVGQMNYKGMDGKNRMIGTWNQNALNRPVFHTYVHLATPLQDGVANTIVLPDGTQQSFTYNASDPLPIIKVNQVGYLASAQEKWAYLGGWRGTGGALPLNSSYSFTVKDSVTGTNVLSSSFTKRMNTDVTFEGISLTGEETLEADISALHTEGTYYIEVEGLGRSMDFRVSDDAAADQFAVHMNGMYLQRCGCAKTEPYTHHTDAACHLSCRIGVHPSNDDEMMVRGNDNGTRNFGGSVPGDGRSIIAANLNNCTTVTNAFIGGWHDAADYDRRPYHLSTVCDFAVLYLMKPGNFFDGQLAIPENNNGIPDLLDEADWGLKYLLAAQCPDGGVGGWIEATTHPAYGTANQTSLMPSQDALASQYCIGIPTHRSTLKYCGAAALLARALYAANTTQSRARADIYKASAVKAWNYVKTHARVTQVMKSGSGATVTYTEPQWYDPYEYVRAAVNLGEITADTSYFGCLTDNITYRGGGADNYNYGDNTYPAQGFLLNAGAWCLTEDETTGRVGFLLNELGLDSVYTSYYSNILSAWRSQVVANADKMITQMSTTMSYRIPWWSTGDSNHFRRMTWGAVVPLRRAMWLCSAHFLTGDAKYLKAAQLACDFQSGCNPKGATWTSGLGKVYPVRFENIHSFADDFDEAIPGITPFYNTYNDWENLGRGNTICSTYMDEVNAKPIFRRAEFGENLSVSISEYTINQTLGPCCCTSGYLIVPGHTSANLDWPMPASDIRNLPGYWALP